MPGAQAPPPKHDILASPLGSHPGYTYRNAIAYLGHSQCLQRRIFFNYWVIFALWNHLWLALELLWEFGGDRSGPLPKYKRTNRQKTVRTVWSGAVWVTGFTCDDDDDDWHSDNYEHNETDKRAQHPPPFSPSAQFSPPLQHLRRFRDTFFVRRIPLFYFLFCTVYFWNYQAIYLFLSICFRKTSAFWRLVTSNESRLDHQPGTRMSRKCSLLSTMLWLRKLLHVNDMLW